VQTVTFNYVNGPAHAFPPGTDQVDAEFRGFDRVVEIRPSGNLDCDFATSDYYVGVTTQCQTPSSITYLGNFYALTDTCLNCSAWDYGPYFNASSFVRHERSNQFMTGRGYFGRTWLYDAYGNAAEACEYPSWTPGTPCSGPTRRTVTQYAYNPALNIVSTEKQSDVIHWDGTVLSSKLSFYDGSTNLNAAPQKGEITLVKELRSGTVDYVATGTFGYDGYGNRTSEKDGRGDETVYQYDASGCDKRAPSAVTAGKTPTYAGQTTTYSYDCVFVKPTTITDPNGAQSNIRYDQFGRRISEWAAGDSETYPTVSYSYNWGAQAPLGTVVNRREQAGTGNVLTESEWFDGLGRLIQQRHERPGGSSQVEIEYDNEGHKDSESLPCASSAAPDSSGSCTVTPLKTRYDYDFLGRVSLVTNPDNNTRTISYSGTDRIVSEIDERGHKTSQRKDEFNRTTQVYEYPGTQGTGYGNPSTTLYAYDAADRLLQITDNAGNAIINGYDKMGRKTSLNDPDTGPWSYEYEDDGDFKSQTDPRGIKISMQYDSLGRLTTKAYSRNGQPVTDAPTILTTTTLTRRRSRMAQA